MARIRTIKPDFFTHEALFDLEKETKLPIRVAFAGLWTQCDREGRFKWKARTLKSAILPFDEVEFSDVLDALWDAGFIVKYLFNEDEYGYVPTFLDHQVINNREADSNLPNPCPDSIVTRGARVPHAWGTRLKHAQGERKGKEGKGIGKEGKDASPILVEEKGKVEELKTEEEEKKETPPSFAAPPSFELPLDFVPHWERWREYKKKQFRFTYKSSDSEQEAIKKLFSFSRGDPQVAAEIISQSIANGWSGLFELKNNNNGGRKINTAIVKPVPKGGFGAL